MGRAVAWCMTLMVAAACARSAGKPEAARVEGPRRVAVLPFRVRGFIDSTGRFASDPNSGPMDEELGAYVAEKLTADLTALGAPVVPASTVAQATPVPGAALYDTKLAARVARE